MTKTKFCKTSIFALLITLFFLTIHFGCAKKEPSPPQPGYPLKVVSVSDITIPQQSMPRFVRRNSDTKVKTAVIQMGTKQFDIILPADDFIRECCLVPKDEPENPPRWWGADRLDASHFIDGKFYRLVLNNTSDRILVEPYTHDVGIFKVGKGNRDIEKIEVSGSIESKDTAVMIGSSLEDGWPQPTTELTVPAGDYRPTYITINMDNLSIAVSYNYHTNAKGQKRNDPERQDVYGMTVTKDTPYTLDFSNKPVVIFESPTDNYKVKLGEELNIVALLIDPDLDIMIRGLRDTSQKETIEYNDSQGNKQSYERDKSLDPTVTIARIDGEVITEGKMPFG